MKLTIIIPVFNEVSTIEELINTILNLRAKFEKEIIIVDDNSIDGTVDILKKYENQIHKLIFHKKNCGKGAAIRSGQQYISGDYVIIQDADLEYDPNDYEKMLDFLIQKKLKVVYGSRVLKKNKFENSRNFSHIVRIWGNVFLTSISNFLNNQNLTDAHTCYKLFEVEIFKKITLEENGFSFCPEINTKLSNLNIEIKEVQINYRGRTYDQGKKIKAIDGIYAILAILKYKYFK